MSFGSQNYRNVVTGKDGQLFVQDSSGRNILLGEVDTFQTQVNVNNATWQPVGDIVEYAVGTGISITLTLTETVIRDDITIGPLLDSLRRGLFPLFSFQGVLRRRPDAPGAGQEERIVFENCSPDGAIDIMNLTPGEIVKRAWSFRVNAVPRALNLFV